MISPAETLTPRRWADFWAIEGEVAGNGHAVTPQANGHAAPPVPQASGEAATNGHAHVPERDFFASNPATAREKMIVDAIQLDVLGSTRKNGVKVFSLHHRRSVIIDRPAKLYYEDLLQIAGDPVKERIALSKDEAEDRSDVFLMSEVKHAIALLAGYRTLSEETELGMGCWQGATQTGEVYPSVVLVGRGEAAEWNGDQILHRIDHPRCRGHILDFESAGESWYDHASLAELMQQCKDPEFRKGVLNDVLRLFKKWRWRNSASPHIVTALVFATWIQTIWEWRPQVTVVGESSSGKTMLVQCISRLFGKLAKTSSDSSAAGMRQIIQSSARVIIHDEFDLSSNADKGRKVEHDKILKMLRSSGRGDEIIRGTSDQKGQSFTLRHIVWLAGIHLASNQEADRNRSICLELLKKLPDAPKLVLPTESELNALGQKMLAVSIYCANEAKRMAAAIREHRVEGVHDRIVESYAVPAALLAVIKGEGETEAIENLEFMLAEMSTAEREVTSDVDDLLHDIFAAQIQIGPERLSVSQMLTKVIKQGSDWMKADDALQARGIRLSYFGSNKDTPSELAGRECLAIAHKTVSSQLLKGTRWEGQAIDMTLRRYAKAVSDRKLIGGAFSRCMSLPLDQIRNEFLDWAETEPQPDPPSELPP